MRGLSPIPADTRHRLSSLSTEEPIKRRFQRSKYFNDVERALRFPIQERNFICKLPTLKVFLIIIVFGTFLTLYRSPAIYNTDHSHSTPFPTLIDRWTTDNHVADPRYLSSLNTTDNHVADPRYLSSLNINWDQVSITVEKLPDKDDFKGVGLLNFNDDEIDQWKYLIPDADHVILHLGPAAGNITWESLYPEWIDEDEDFEVPTCPSLPKLNPPAIPRLDLIAVKLPCNKSGKWTRDVVRFHLQLAVAEVAASIKSYHPIRILLLTECFPLPNLFTCKELLNHEGDAWLYEPYPSKLRDKVQLPLGSCELSVPLKAKENFHSARVSREAYATVLHSAEFYVCGAITAAESIRMAGSIRDLVILVDETISEYHREGLAAAGWKIHTIKRIRNPKAEPDAYNEWNYSKFRLWQLTDYDKIIFIDSDMLILRNIDFLFEMPEISAIGNNASLFNSGVMVIEPSNCTFQLLMDHINEIESYNGGDQGYLNEIFTWWHRIPKHMNFLKHFWEGDEPEKKALKTRLFEADPPVLYVLHYLGTKPWLCFRDYDCNWNVDILQQFASDVAHQTWWKVHDAMPENLQKYCLLSSQQKAALEWDRRQAEKGNYTDGHWKIKIKDKRLNTCFEDFCFWESMLWHWGEKNWTDNATASLAPPMVTVSPSLRPIFS